MKKRDALKATLSGYLWKTAVLLLAVGLALSLASCSSSVDDEKFAPPLDLRIAGFSGTGADRAVNLVWDAPDSELPITEYVVYRDEEELDRTADNDYREIIGESDYNYYVTALYSDDAESGQSNTVNTADGATGGGPVGPGPGPGNGEEWPYDEDAMCGNPYFPVAPGISHTYKLSGTNLDGKEIEGTHTSTIISVSEDGFTVQWDMDDNFVQQSYTQEHQWECLPEGLIDKSSPGGLESMLVDIEGVAIVGTPVEVTGISMPHSMSVGDTWSQSYQGSLIVQESAEVEYSGTFNMAAVSEETVTVPAGTFTALRVDSEILIEYAMGAQGITMPYMTDTATSSTWYVWGIGIVKTTVDHVITGMIAGEITLTQELTGYSLP